jgi:hypothetical protein
MGRRERRERSGISNKQTADGEEDNEDYEITR